MEKISKKVENPSVYPDPMRGAKQSFLNHSPWQLETGMTLRDYFANSAMQGLHSDREMFLSVCLDRKNFAKDKDNNTVENYIAEISYKMADAMLKEREI
jgi:hypothetical protein